jgi:NADPH:quinone reductase-like Zn-dependent oxidoreductase
MKAAVIERYFESVCFVAGQDFAGTVSEVGADVHGYRRGERVLGVAREHGSYAEHTALPLER